MAGILESLNISEVMISLDGATAETNDLIRGKGTFEKILKAIRALQQTDIFTGATLTLTKYNIGEIEAYLDLCFNKGLHYAWINPPVYTGRLPEFEIAVDYTQHVKMMKKVKLLDVKYFKYGFGVYYNVPYYSLTDPVSPLIDLNTACPWGRSNLTIKTDGSVLPCLYSRDLILGNVFTDSLVELFNHPILENFRNLSSLEEPCKSCQYLWFCGGCRARTFYLTGNWMARDPWCPLTRGVAEEDLKVTRGDFNAI
jgi:radical SAM protein with 4Fe4S-binding SPASM domain